MSVIADTTVLSNFAQLARIEMLRQLFGEVHLAVEVYQEIQAGLEEGYSFYSCVDPILAPAQRDGWLHLTGLTSDEELALFATLPAQLHYGEASCLAIAKRRGWLFLTDDRAARTAAKARQVQVSGTLGCLVSGVERGLWTQPIAQSCLTTLLSLGFYSPTDDLAHLIRQQTG